MKKRSRVKQAMQQVWLDEKDRRDAKKYRKLVQLVGQEEGFTFSAWTADKSFALIKAGEREFHPTLPQIKIIRYLHKLAISGVDSIHQTELRNKALGFDTKTRLRDVFRSRGALYSMVIETLSFPKGHVRLKT